MKPKLPSYGILLTIVALCLPEFVRGSENRYDVLSKTIMPFLGVLAKDRKGQDRAFRFKVRIESASNLPKELAGTEAQVALQVPNQLRLDGPLLGERFTLVRDDEKIWISPGAKAKALLDATTAGRELPPAPKKYKLADFRLPFPEKQLIFLPALFTVKDLGTEMLDGAECRAMDVSLMPQLAESLKAEGWVARLWTRPDYTPARLTVARKGWHIVLRFDEVEFAEKFDGATWEPTPEQATDVLELEPKEYSRFLRAIGGSDK